MWTSVWKSYGTVCGTVSGQFVSVWYFKSKHNIFHINLHTVGHVVIILTFSPFSKVVHNMFHNLVHIIFHNIAHNVIHDVFHNICHNMFDLISRVFFIKWFHNVLHIFHIISLVAPGCSWRSLTGLSCSSRPPGCSWRHLAALVAPGGY